MALLPSCDRSGPDTPHTSPKSNGPVVHSKDPAHAFIDYQSHSQLSSDQRVYLSGCAKYRYWHITKQPGTNRLQKHARENPMRYNEIQVYNTETKEYVQGGHLDRTGCFKELIVPRSSAPHYIRITTRTNISVINASVLKQTENRHYYYLEMSLTPERNHHNINFVAQHNDTNLSGAPFFILDQIVGANLRLRQQVCQQQSNFELSNCLKQFDFTKKAFTTEAEAVESRLEVFWKKGFNPGRYCTHQPASSQLCIDANIINPTSFYLVYTDPQDHKTRHRIFISGGANGQIDEDTDHWDASVIIHEYAHYLENRFSLQHSPGGSHTGVSQIDPRLAWSEGWANFFQAFVLNQGLYIDSIEADTAEGPFNTAIDLEKTCTGTGQTCYDDLEESEGHFREFAVSRFLWDWYDPRNLAENQDCAAEGFASIWNNLKHPRTQENPYPGLNPYKVFGDMGLFQLSFRHQQSSQLTDQQNLCWNSLSRAHGMGADRREFAYLLKPRPSSGTPSSDAPSSGPSSDDNVCTFSTGSTITRAPASGPQFLNLLTDYDFFLYRHTSQNAGSHPECTRASAPALSLQLNPTATRANTNFKLYIYQKSNLSYPLHQLLSQPDLQAQSFVDTSEEDTAPRLNTCLPIGEYLIVVANLSSRLAEYRLQLNGNTPLCHINSVLE